MPLIASPRPLLESRSEWLIAGLAFVIVAVLFVADVVAGTRVFARYWPLIGIILGLCMLAGHRLIAPEEW